jgi:hypothetical protein
MLQKWLGNGKAQDQARAPVPAVEPAAPRDRQKNLKASAQCLAAFGAIAKAEGLSEAALFEELVAERYDALCARGIIKRASKEGC